MEQELRQRITELERENLTLRTFNELLQEQRKEHLDMLLGPVREEDLPTDEEYLEMTKTRVSADLILSDLDEILKNGAA